MAKILSRQARSAAVKVEEPAADGKKMFIILYGPDGFDKPAPMTTEELAHIHQVFETIRRSLSAICGR